LRQAVIERPWDRLVGGLALGRAAFAKRLAGGWGAAGGQKEVGRLARRLGWAEIIWVVERWKGEGWGEFCDRPGDWGRDAALWLGRRAGRLWLGELGRLALGNGVCGRSPGGDPLRPANGTNSGIASGNSHHSNASVEKYGCDPSPLSPSPRVAPPRYWWARARHSGLSKARRSLVLKTAW